MHISRSVKASSTPVSSQARSPAAKSEQTPAIVTPSPTTPKENREYEHHRQRVKKAAETANLRVRKLANATRQLSVSQPRAPPTKERKSSGVLVDVADLKDPLPDNGKDYEEEPVALHNGKFEVSLADFVVTRKSRKGTGNDFEIIPHIRSVIILDDNQTHDVDIDEPWEYINGLDEDQVRTKPFSYAMVAARAK